MAATLHYLGYVSQDLGKYAEAEKYYRRSIRIWEGIRDKDAPELVRVLSNQLSLYTETGQSAKAERLRRRCQEVNPEALGPDSVDAARLYPKALAIRENSGAPEHQEVATVWNNLGLVAFETGRHSEALAHFERAIKIWEKRVGPDHPMLANGLNNLAILHWLLDRPEESELFFKRALAIAENSFRPEHPLQGGIMMNYATILRKLKRKGEARQIEKRAHAILARAFRDNPARYTVDVRELAGLPGDRPRR